MYIRIAKIRFFAKKMGCQIFYPVSSCDFVVLAKPTRRYRHAYGDVRLQHRVCLLQQRMVQRQSVTVNRLGENRSEKAAFYSVLNNPYVELSELIHYSCQISPQVVDGASVLCLLDTTSVSLVSRLKEGRKAQPSPGVVNDNHTPGFFISPSLVIEEYKQAFLGLGDMVVFDRPKAVGDAKANQEARKLRAALPSEHKESYVWALSASNTQKQLGCARQVTYVIDQGGDSYAALAQLRSLSAGADFIVRVKENRVSTHAHTGEKGRVEDHLRIQAWQDTQQVPLRALDHQSKSSGKQVIRQARKAQMKLRFLPLLLSVPAKASAKDPHLSDPVFLIEVLEDHTSVPEGEAPIHWRLMTSRTVESIEQAWHIVSCYQARWHIEQLFRVFKKQGMDIEQSQFEGDDAVKRQAILALKAASQVMQLTMAREQKDCADIQTVFPEEQQRLLLKKINQKVSGKTAKSANPHPENTLTWAVWIIARLGGWNGYEKGRKPGPLTLHRGIERFNTIVWANNLIFDT